MSEFEALSNQRSQLMQHVSDLLHQKVQVQQDGCPFEGVRVSSDTVLRRLGSKERKALKTLCRCSCKDWSKIFLLLPRTYIRVDHSDVLQRLVSDNQFDGCVILDLTAPENSDPSNPWHRLPPGIHSNLMIADSIFQLRSCRVYRNLMLSNTYVAEGAAVLQCGHISTHPASHDEDETSGPYYGTLSISVGPESGGGRTLHLTSEDTMVHVAKQLGQAPPPSNSIRQEQHPSPNMNVIGAHSIVRDTATLQNIFLHDHASIEAAASVSQATLFPQSHIGGESTVCRVLMQWNTSIDDHSSVTDALLMEQAHAGPHSLVVSSVLGPDVHVSAGEIHASIIGPNTNAHHQSLVIGVLWPLGRGNVGYGANVGSNHTGRLPDQETTAGEGVFWGLSTVIKFPVDLTSAPYSVIAAGTTLPPQRVTMPFSLILTGSSGVNEIIPGWVLRSSPYTLARSEEKYATRRKAKRHDYYTGWKIFRPEVIELCRWAKLALEAGEDGNKVLGIGSNTLSSKARSMGIQAYTDCIHRYALSGLLKWILSQWNDRKSPLNLTVLQTELTRTSSSIVRTNPNSKVNWPEYPWETKLSNEWEFQRSLLLEYFPIKGDIASWLESTLRQLVTLEGDFANRVYKSKSRDDTRGANTIPGYAHSHIAAENDKVIDAARIAADKVRSDVTAILDAQSGRRSRL
eukprot:Nitzschia sp. Nitz4//scaffold9_size221794//82636//84690//NITZ4_001341-RA/size221794-processed-gene-0.323-mRNA-1//-1//CDS//3329560986//3475//frame0